jgi:hypothetical protein
MLPFNPKKNIEDVDDYINWADELFEEYLSKFTREDGLIRDVNEDDWVDHEECAFLYTAKGLRLADKMKRLLTQVGENHFPEEDIEIETYLFKNY